MEQESLYGQDLAKYRLNRAKEEIDTSEALFHMEKYKAANNRAYYAIYYAITAILALETIAFKKHKDTLAYFNKQYVHEGKFPKDIGKQIAKAQRIRHDSDYNEMYIASKEETRMQIQAAGRLTGLVEAYINNIKEEDTNTE